MSTSTCAYCSRPFADEPVTLWDGKTYCSKCIDEASPELRIWALDDALTDVLAPSDVHGWIYLFYMWPRFMLISLVLAAIPMLIAIAVQRWEGVLAGLVIIAGLGGFAFVFLGLQALIGHFVFRSRLPRTIAIRDGKLTVAHGGKTSVHDLSACKWQSGATMVDAQEMFTPLRSGLVLYLSDGAVAIGHSPGSAERWQAFLRLAHVPRNQPFGCGRLLLFGIAGLIAGCSLGIAAGFALVTFGQPEFWKGVFGLLGALDGTVIALIYRTATSEHAEAARKRLHPLALAQVREF